MAWFGFAPPMTMRATVWERDGELLGLAGYYIAGARAVVFSEMRGGAPKVKVWRAAKAFMADFNLPAVCWTDTGGAFLERLGWTQGEGGEYQWQP